MILNYMCNLYNQKYSGTGQVMFNLDRFMFVESIRAIFPVNWSWIQNDFTYLKTSRSRDLDIVHVLVWLMMVILLHISLISGS